MPAHTALEKLGLASFGGISFPIETWTIKQEFRAPQHEYPKQPGGQYEKLGRKTLHISFKANFHDTLNDAYPGLWPTGLNNLVALCETQATDTLIVPGLGPIQATCLSWSQEFAGLVQSGASVPMEFGEDSLNISLGLLQEPSGAIALPSQMAALSAAWANDMANPLGPSLADPASVMRLADGSEVPNGSIFDALRTAVLRIQSVQDQGSLYDNLFQADVLTAMSLCSTLERSVSLQDPRADASFQALMTLWGSLVATEQNLLSQTGQLVTYTTPTLMSVDDVSTAIFGNAGHSDDILSANALDDPYAIPAGTPINYIQVAA